VGLSLGVAQEAKPSVAWSTAGSASLTWGYNILDGSNGFNNSAAGEFTLTLVPAGAFTKGADAPVYGWITLTTLSLDILNGATPAFVANGATAPTAGIVAGPLAISVYGAPGFTYTYAGFVPLFAADAGYAITGAVTPLLGIKGGTTIKYTMADVASIALNLGSDGDYGVTAAAATSNKYEVVIGAGTETAATGVSYTDLTGAPVGVPLVLGMPYIKITNTAATAASNGTQYSIGADVSLLAVKGLTLNAGGGYDMASQNVILGAQAGYAMAPISVMFGIDGTMAASVLTFDMAANLTLTLGKDTVAFNMYGDNTAGGTAPLRLDTGLSLTDAEGLVPGLNASVAVFAYDLLASPANNPMMIAVGETASYKVALSDTTYVKPFETFYYQLVGPMTYLDVGVAAGLFPNTVITAEFVGGTTGVDNNMGIIATDMAASQVFKITTTISY